MRDLVDERERLEVVGAGAADDLGVQAHLHVLRGLDARHDFVAHVLEEHLGEALVTVEAPEAPHGHAVELERHQQVGEALVPLAVGVGAEQAEQVRAERATGGPGLLAGDAPAAALVVTDGLALDARQVAAGVGLAAPVAPEVFGAGHARVVDAIGLTQARDAIAPGCRIETGFTAEGSLSGYDAVVCPVR